MLALGYRHAMQTNGVFLLKAVLLHIGNIYPSVPFGHAVHMKESYENMAHLLNKINYKKYKWHISADLQVVAILGWFTTWIYEALLFHL
jgi:hypothetical protein